MFLIGDDFWEVRQTKDKGMGVFARKTITKGTVISDYLGKVIKTADYDLELDKNGLYLMYYSDQASIYPDLDKPGPHLVNHSCDPNCWIYIYKGHTLFYSLRNIEAGEEITINYLLSPDDTHVCVCGSEKCTGLMRGSQRRVNGKTHRAKIVFGQNLSPLASYPKVII